MEDNTNKKSNSKVIIIMIIIFAILIIGTGIALLINSNIITTNNTSNTTNNINDNTNMISTDIEPIDIPTKGNYSQDDAEKILQKFGLSINGKLSANGGVYQLGYTDEFKFIVAVENVSTDKKHEQLCGEVYEGRFNIDYGYKSPETDGVCRKENKVTVINYDDINNVYKEMYGTDAPKKSVKVMGQYYRFYDYNRENNTYNSLECGACGGTTGPAVYKLREANLNDDILEITVAYGYSIADYVDEELSHKIHYNDKGIADNLTNEDLDKMSNYKITFKKDGKNFIYQSIEKINKNIPSYLTNFDSNKGINTGNYEFKNTYEASNTFSSQNNNKFVEYAKAVIKDNKKEVKVTIDWKFFTQGLDGYSDYEDKYYSYTLSFDKEVSKVYIVGSGLATGFENIYYVMSDGTVEYTPITYKIAGEAIKNPEAFKLESNGKIEGIEGVNSIVKASMHEKDSQIGWSYTALAMKSDGSFYNLPNYVK